jgi:hypothetical protein
MKCYLMLAAFAVLSASSGLSVPTVRAAEKDEKGHMAMCAECAKVCGECQVACDVNFHHCFKMVESGKKEHAKAAHLSVDCAEFCAISSKLMARQSELAGAACEACAKACETCCAECEKYADIPEMKACAESCKKCAASCREMVKHAAK